MATDAPTKQYVMFFSNVFCRVIKSCVFRLLCKMRVMTVHKHFLVT
jgi:hypothetical protein